MPCFMDIMTMMLMSSQTLKKRSCLGTGGFGRLERGLVMVIGFPSFSPLHGVWVGFSGPEGGAWSRFSHTFPTFHTPCMGKGWALSGKRVGLPPATHTLRPPFTPFVWVLGGLSLGRGWAWSRFSHPFPTFHTPCMGKAGFSLGEGWAWSRFSYTFPTFHTPCMGKGWVFSGRRVRLVTLLPHSSHLSYPLHGERLGFLWLRVAWSRFSPHTLPPFIPLAWGRLGFL